MINIIFGGIMIIGGLSGKLALIGTNSSGALVVVGFLVGGYGVYQVARQKRDRAGTPPP